mgnify:CR=1 FL=1
MFIDFINVAKANAREWVLSGQLYFALFVHLRYYRRRASRRCRRRGDMLVMENMFSGCTSRAVIIRFMAEKYMLIGRWRSAGKIEEQLILSRVLYSGGGGGANVVDFILINYDNRFRKRTLKRRYLTIYLVFFLLMRRVPVLYIFFETRSRKIRIIFFVFLVGIIVFWCGFVFGYNP